MLCRPTVNIDLLCSLYDNANLIWVEYRPDGFYMKCFVCQSVQTLQYERKVVGYSSALDNNKIDITMKKSRLACGNYCSEMVIILLYYYYTSFI